MSRFCTNCGAALEGSSKFCIHCGAPIQMATQASESQSSEQAQDSNQSQTPNQHRTSFEELVQQRQQQQQQQQPFGFQEQMSQQSDPRVQGSDVGGGMMAPKPNNYLALSILATIFCCWPFGIPAIVNAARVDKFWREGDNELAEEASKKAKRWTIISAIVGLVIFAIIFLASMSDLEP